MHFVTDCEIELTLCAERLLQAVAEDMEGKVEPVLQRQLQQQLPGQVVVKVVAEDGEGEVE